MGAAMNFRLMDPLRLGTVLLFLAAPAAASGLPTAPPESLGFAPDRLARIDTALQRYVDQKTLAGVTVVIARDGKAAYEHSAGMADREAARPMRPDTLARFYSMTKPVTAVAVMMLVEEGRLRLTDRLADYLPEFADPRVLVGEGPETEKAARPILVHHLLTHTSGLTYGGGLFAQTPVGKLYDAAQVQRPDRTLAEFSTLIASLPLAVQPGTSYNYGVSTDILGRLVEVVSGQPFDQFVKQRIFEPLAMADSSFTLPPEKADRFAALYEKAPEGGLRPVSAAQQLSRFRADAKLISGGGGMISTADDYLRFCQMLLNGGELDGERLLSPKTIDLMTTGQLARDQTASLQSFMPGYGVGLGFAVLEDLGRSQLPGSVGEYNWAGAANTFFFIDPRENLIALLVTQHYPAGTLPLREDLKALVYQALTEVRHGHPAR